MTLPEMLKKYRMVLVTGPQRSGTTIMSHMLAEDLGWHLFDEEAFDVENMGKWWDLVHYQTKGVIQCPSMMHMCAGLPDDVAVVVMSRSIQDIFKSQQRIGWDFDYLERTKFASFEDSATAKYKWLADNMDTINNLYLVNYGNGYMREHRLWKNKKERVAFGPKQVQ